MKRHLFAGALAAAFGLVSPKPAAANIITYTLMGDLYTGDTFKLTAIGDTSAAYSCGGFSFIPCVPLSSATITVASHTPDEKTGTLAGPIVFFDNQIGPFAGFARPAGGVLFAFDNDAFVDYSSVSPIGPLIVTYDQGTPVDTTFGSVDFRNLSAVFSASVAPSGVPEPATWAMMLLGFGGIGFAMRCRKDRVPHVA